MSDQTPKPPRYHWSQTTPLVGVIASKYQRRKLHEWDNARTFKLASDLGVSLDVLCARVGLFHHVYDEERDIYYLELDRQKISSYRNRNRWPVWLAVQFEVMEAHAAIKNGNIVPMVGTCNLIDAKILAGTLTPTRKAGNGGS